MDCRLVEERLSDHLEGALEPRLLPEIESHLAECQSCRELRRTLPDVIDALRSMHDPAPSTTLAARVADAALRVRKAERTATWLSFGVPQWMQTAAAGVALILSGAALYALGPEQVSRSTSGFFERTVGAGTSVRAQADRVVEDIRVLRVMVGTALEGRLDGVNDRVRDYRRILQKRRASPAEPKDPSPSEVGKDGPRSEVTDRGSHVADLSEHPRQPTRRTC